MPDLICIEKCRNGLENCIGDALVILAGPAQAGLELECLRLSQLEQFPYAAVSPDVIPVLFTGMVVGQNKGSAHFLYFEKMIIKVLAY
ncbi:MAG: hypothetical protein OXD43_12835 [Bacteroidetes bacterium]|nr:hypothetical protein [Bacteroidota bacterium]